MSTQHTPGPWSYRGSLGPQSNPHLLGPHVVENATGIQIAILNGWRSEVSEANARLIAAAPALLEALEWIANRCPEQMLKQPLHTIHREAVYDAGACARAAIAAAKGEA
jgi:hypothetical protein